MKDQSASRSVTPDMLGHCQCCLFSTQVSPIPGICHHSMRCSVLASTSGGVDRRSEHERCIMKIVVIGGSGLIGSKLVTRLREHGHEAVAASPDSGVNTLTG